MIKPSRYKPLSLLILLFCLSFADTDFGSNVRINESIDAYNTAIEVDPRWATPWNGKGVVLQRMGRNAEAKAALVKAKELGFTD